MQRSANFDRERSELSLNGFGVEFTDWEGIFESGKAATRTNKRIVTTISGVRGSILHIVQKNMYHMFHAQD